MAEMKNLADTIMQNIETEFDCPSAHPELNFKVPMLDLAMWVEEIPLAAQGLEDQGMHANCKEGELCLPIGTPPCATPAHRGRPSGPNIVQTIPVLTPQPGSQAQHQHQNLQPVEHPSSGKQTTVASPECDHQSCAPPAQRGFSPGGSIDNISSSLLIQSPGSQTHNHNLQLARSAPHPIPGLRYPGNFSHPRTCRDDLDSLATRARETSS